MENNVKKKDMKKKIIIFIMIVIFYILCFIAGFKLAEKFDGEFDFNQWMFGLFIAGISYFIHVVIHEGGHLLFGLLTGYEFVSFRIGSMMFIRKDGKFIRKKYTIPGTGGQCLLMPKGDDYKTVPYFFYHAGGFIMNFVTSILVLLITLSFDDNYIKMLGMVYSIIGFVIGLMNSIPLNNKITNDGYNILSIYKHDEERKAVFQQMKIIGLITLEEKRLKDMPSEYFELADEKCFNYPLCCASACLTVSRYIDEFKFDKAYELGKNLIENYSMMDVQKYLFYGELMCIELINELEPDYILKVEDKMYKKVIKMIKMMPYVYRMEYAYQLLYKKNEKLTEKALLDFEKSCITHPYISEIESERDYIKLIKETYENRKESEA